MGYAPLIRDGRMEKFYWNPSREDRIVDEFPGQSIDFFGALRARAYDDMVKDFCANIGFENPNMSLDNLLEYGNLLVGEQENVKRVQLADSYLDGAELAGVGGSSMPEKIKGE